MINNASKIKGFAKPRILCKGQNFRSVVKIVLYFYSVSNEQKLLRGAQCLSGRVSDWKRIRIHHEWLDRKIRIRITDVHHDACRVMTPVIAWDGFFYYILARIMDSFSCSPLITSFYIGVKREKTSRKY